MTDFSERVRRASTRQAEEETQALAAERAQAETERAAAAATEARLRALDETLDAISDAIAAACLAERDLEDALLLSEFGSNELRALPPVRNDSFSGPSMFGIPGFFRTRQRRAVCEDHHTAAWRLVALDEAPHSVQVHMRGLHLTAHGALAHPSPYPVGDGRLSDGRQVSDCTYADLGEIAADPVAHELLLDALADFAVRFRLSLAL